MTHRICFIDDDSAFEIPLFREAFEGFFEVITATTFRDCKTELERHANRVPDLFVLDLYFARGEPDIGAVEKLRSEPLELLPDGGDLRQAYVNFKKAGDRLNHVLKAWRQGRRGGIDLARTVRRDYPRVPIVFYSRKASLDDALVCMQQPNVVNVVRKPTGGTDEETRDITLNPETRKRLADVFANSMDLSRNRNVKITIGRIIESVDMVAQIHGTSET